MLVGLSGPALSGKDTVYGILRSLSFEGPLTPYLVRREGFADRLKISAARALGFDGSPELAIDFCNVLKSEGKSVSVRNDSDYTYRQISGREYLQFFGTEAHRDIFGQDFWVKAVLPDGYPSDDEREKTLLIITDVRFPNEAERIHECGGQVWKIERPIDGIAESAHASEQPLPSYLIDHTIFNNGNLDDLREKVETSAKWVLECSLSS